METSIKGSQWYQDRRDQEIVPSINHLWKRLEGKKIAPCHFKLIAVVIACAYDHGYFARAKTIHITDKFEWRDHVAGLYQKALQDHADTQKLRRAARGRKAGNPKGE